MLAFADLSTVFFFSYKVSTVASNATPTLLWENSHNTLVKWAWDAWGMSLLWKYNSKYN